jgi:hypothetical protein
MLIAAGCSSGSDSDSSDDAGQASPSVSASPSPTVRAAAYATLPEACDVLSEKTLDELVPEAKSGKEGDSDDIASRANCSWDSLDNNGVKGSQFRWLNVSLFRFESDVARGAGDELAQDFYTEQVADAQAVEGAKSVETEPLTGTGDVATAVRYDLKKKEGTFKQQSVVARAENVVVIVDYNGAGLAGDRTPDAGDLMKLAKKAAKEAVDEVEDANEADKGSSAKSSPKSPAKSATSGSSSSKSSSDSSSSSSSSNKRRS